MATRVLNRSAEKASLCFFVLISLFSASAFKSRPPKNHSYAHMVFGIDDRHLFPLRKRPWASLGRVEVELEDKTWSHCTGSLVGPDLVLTGAHCLVVEGKERGSNIWFRAGLQGHSKVAEAKVVRKWFGTEWPDENRAEDWAILQLDQPLGNKVGWLQLSPELIEEEKKIAIIGYADDFLGGNKVAIQSNCRLRSRRFGYFMHDCDMNAGTSGAPMVVFRGRTPRVVAMNVAHTSKLSVVRSPFFSSKDANVAVSLFKCAELLKELGKRS